MIIDKLENRFIYSGLNSRLVRALEYLASTDFNDLDNGKYEIDDDNIFAIVNDYKTKNLSEGKPESHKKYIDVQYLHSGEEFIGYAPLRNQKITEPYNEANDIIFYDCEQSLLLLQKGMFAIFFPDDIHMPAIRVNNPVKVKKVVVKVRV